MLHVSAHISEDRVSNSKHRINTDDNAELMLDLDVSDCEQPDRGVYDN
jgi:hypothetical protein